MLNLRIHTSYSFVDCFGPLNELKNLDNQNVLSVTDTNTFSYHLLRHQKTEDNKIIYGVELNTVDDPESVKSRNSIKDKFVLLARNLSGAKEIFKIVSKANENKRYFPCITFQDFFEIKNDDIIGISTDINSYLLFQLDSPAFPVYFGISNTFNYFEKELLFQIKDKNKIIAISDNLFFKKEDRKLYEIFSTNASIDNKNSHLESNYWNRYLLSEEEWRDSMKYILSKETQDIAIKNTFLINEMIESYDFEQAKLPEVEEKRSLEELCKIGAQKKGIDLEQEPYKSQLKFELDIINSKEIFYNYFYIVRDLCNWARSQMLVGPARGSAGASLVCYLLEITDFDPMPHDLVFTRFLNPHRLDLPDIDIDFQSQDPIFPNKPCRDDCIEYLEKKYGYERVGKVGRLLNIKGKSLYHLLYPFYPQLKDYENLFPDDVEESKSKNDNPQYIRLGKTLSEQLNDSTLEQIYRIYGQPIGSGLHPAGIIVANKNLTEFQAVGYPDIKNKKERNLQIDVYDAENVGLLKIDCLGLETLTLIHNCLDVIGKDKSWLNSLDLEDQKVYETVFKNAETTGVFQFEGKSLQETVVKIGVRQFSDICVCTAIARPAAMRAGNVDKYAKGNLENIKSERLKKVLSGTRGVLVYQEQLMKICAECFNAPADLVEKARKVISKSKGEAELLKIKESMWEYGKEAGYSEEDMNEAWETIKKCGSYLFNKAHSVAYGILSFWCAYLKTYYPFEFLISILNSTNDIIKTSSLILHLINRGYNLRLYDENLSELRWTYLPKEQMILGPLTVLSGISVTKAREIIKIRKKEGEFTPGIQKIFLSKLTKYNFIFEFRQFWKKMEGRGWTKFFNNKPAEELIPEEEEQTLFFYLIDKEEKVSSKGNHYLKIKGYNGKSFFELMHMKKEGEKIDLKKEKYYIALINSGSFIKKIIPTDMDYILNEEVL